MGARPQKVGGEDPIPELVGVRVDRSALRGDAQECRTWRSRAERWIRTHRQDLVIVSNSRAYKLLDSRGKPKAALFGREHASLAIKAATQLQLNVLASNDPKVAEIAARLPVGRVHATGRTFVPFIRRDLYDRLVAAAPNGNFHQPLTPPASSGAALDRSRLRRR